MAKPSFSSRILVLKKTKLGESDLIITALQEDGSLLRAVAKGARKPSNPFAARLDIFTVSSCLLSKGKNLDVFCEARVEEAHLPLKTDIVLNAAASPIAEALAACMHEDLEVPRIFPIACAALSYLESSPAASSPAFTCAFLLKMLAMLGFRPSFGNCIGCGQEIDPGQITGTISFSYPDGGVLCPECSPKSESTPLDAGLLAWAQLMMMSTFEEIAEIRPDANTAFAVLQFCRSWLRENLGVNLKSLNYLFTCGLF